MADSFLNKNGLTYIWEKIKSYIANAIKQSDWDELDPSSSAYIVNKPTIPPEVVVDDSLSDDSVNPVQNQVIKAALDEKAEASHEHAAGDITSGILGTTRGGTGAATVTPNKVFAGPSSGSAVGNPYFRSLTAVDLPIVPSSKGGTSVSTAAANRIFAGPGSGSATTPSFRALVPADIPNLTTSKIASGIFTVSRGGTGAATASPNRVFAGPTSGTAVGAPSFRTLVAADIPNLSTLKLTDGILGPARGGTGKAYGLTWQLIGGCLGTSSSSFNLGNYAEILVVATFSGKIFTSVLPKAVLTASDQELWVGGGRGDSTAGLANSGARAVCNISLTHLTGVAANNAALNTISETEWHIYAR